MTREPAELVVENLCAQAGGFSLEGVSFTIPAAAHFVLVGPPGSGKTVTVETICGLKRPTAGRIRLGGRDVTTLDPGFRRIGYVPQDYALLPQRDVAGNIALALEADHWPRAKRRERVADLAEKLGIAPLLGREVRTLSGGEKQRVALGRALAFTPQLLVLDEPVSALDENTRNSLLDLLNSLQREHGITTLHVCHNFEEMMLSADVVGVMSAGRIEQSGERDDVVRRPRTRFVAEFMQAKNIFSAQAQAHGGGSELRIGLLAFLVPRALDGDALVAVRPEDVALAPGASGDPARITSVTDRGRTIHLEVSAGVTWHVSMGKSEFERSRMTVEDPVRLVIPPDAFHVINQP